MWCDGLCDTDPHLAFAIEFSSYAAGSVENSVKCMGFPEDFCVRDLYSISSYRSER